MGVRVGQPAPDMEVEYWRPGMQEAGRLSLRDFKGKWIVLCFYTRDFSFICPTELAALAKLQDGFARENTVIVAASTDSALSHKAWLESDERLSDVAFPIIADTTRKLCDAYDVLLEDGSALRGTFIIDPEGCVRHMSVYDVDIGRNVEESLRIVQALQSGQMCHVGWQPDDDTLNWYSEWLSRTFPRLHNAALRKASEELATKFYDPGDIIIQQGAKADTFYILVQGEVSVIHNNVAGEEVLLAKLKAGDVFGEMGILTDGRRTADVRADSPVSLLALDWLAFKRLVEQSDPTARDFMEIIRQRRQGLPG